jgi:hypothetical protein
LTVLNLMWFAAAMRTHLADVGQGGWGAAATAAGSAVEALFFLLITVAGNPPARAAGTIIDHSIS